MSLFNFLPTPVNNKPVMKLGVVIAAFSMVLTGCVSRDMSDLEQYAQKILSRSGGRIEPLPEIKPYEAYTYKAAQQDKRSPFKLFYEKEPESGADEEGKGLSEAMAREIHHRNREELEQFELDSLDMVGTLRDDNKLWAVIRDPEGVVHRVTVGNYMGRNIGKITDVSENKVELREIVKDSQGRWQEREAAIGLSEG